MIREAIEYFKFHRKIFCEDHLKICPKDSIAYQATLKEKEFYDMAIKALLRESKTGHWIKYGIPRCGEQHYKCTNCDEYFNFGIYSDYYKRAFKFCPNCGAKMTEQEET